MKAALAAAMLAAAAWLSSAPARPGSTDGRAEIARKDIPKAVAAAVECGTEPETISRRPFAGGFVFAWDCPGNHANRMQALVFAAHADGAGARLLRFPGARKTDDAWSEISNVRWFAAAHEVTQLFVDPENRGACRSEARWRLDVRKGADAAPVPLLVYLRETRDCAGKSGWRVVVDRRRG